MEEITSCRNLKINDVGGVEPWSRGISYGQVGKGGGGGERVSERKKRGGERKSHIIRLFIFISLNFYSLTGKVTRDPSRGWGVGEKRGRERERERKRG